MKPRSREGSAAEKPSVGDAPNRLTAKASTGPLAIGERFLTWEIRGLLGKGGYAFVYDARDVLRGNEVALKIIPNPPKLDRAKNEANVALSLKHPGIVETTHVGVTEDNFVYFAMERLHGRNLRQILADFGALTVFEMLVIVRQVAVAVAYAHAHGERGVIHRDLKLDNVILQEGGSAKLLDFGIAKVVGEIALTTQKDMLHGTIWYLAPEVLQGRPASFQSDIFALGVMMFELVVGVPPARLGLEVFSFEAIGWAQLNTDFPALDVLKPETPGHVARLVQRTLAKKPAERVDTAAELVAGCDACIQRLVQDAQAQGIVLESRQLWRPRALADEAEIHRAPPVITAETVRIAGSARLNDAHVPEQPLAIGATQRLFFEGAVRPIPTANAIATEAPPAPAAQGARQPRPRLRRQGSSPPPEIAPSQFISGVVPTQGNQRRASFDAPTATPPRPAASTGARRDAPLRNVRIAVVLGSVACAVSILALALLRSWHSRFEPRALESTVQTHTSPATTVTQAAVPLVPGNTAPTASTAALPIESSLAALPSVVPSATLSAPPPSLTSSVPIPPVRSQKPKGTQAAPKVTQKPDYDDFSWLPPPQPTNAPEPAPSSRKPKHAIF